MSSLKEYNITLLTLLTKSTTHKFFGTFTAYVESHCYKGMGSTEKATSELTQQIRNKFESSGLGSHLVSVNLELSHGGLRRGHGRYVIRAALEDKAARLVCG